MYLSKQVTHSVRWIDCIESMKHMGIDTLVEFGPGNALASFVAKIDKSIKVLSIYDLESLYNSVDAIKNHNTLEEAI